VAAALPISLSEALVAALLLAATGVVDGPEIVVDEFIVRGWVCPEPETKPLNKPGARPAVTTFPTVPPPCTRRS